MAATYEGRRLTDVHRRRQLRVAAGADSQVRRATMLLDPSDIEGTRLLWQTRMVDIVSRFHGISEQEAIRYLSAYRVAETGVAGGSLVVPGVDYAATRGLLDGVGPHGFKKRIGQGIPELVAYQQMAAEVMAETRKMILAGGRGVVRESARADGRAVGWRRVASGDPCTFCAMLVSRGPAYTSEAKALANGNGDPYHLHCGCTVEPVYSDWKPTEAEERFIDWYEAAAEAADAADEPRTAQTVLHRMRGMGDFTDSPARRNKKK